MSADRPDVEKLMEEIDAAARRLEQSPVGFSQAQAQPGNGRAPVKVPLNPRLEENWDAWEKPEVTTHRGLLGLPVVWAKKLTLALLAPHDRELLKRQRQFNREVSDELQRLRKAVAELAADMGDVKRSRK
ncbi:MAG: hypothetical protein QM723_36690 [Myxococcaceae bacterium]